MKKIIFPLPSFDFDPTEVSVPWKILRDAGHMVIFATPDAVPARADEIMVTGKRLGILGPMLRADHNALECYDLLIKDSHFLRPISYNEIKSDEFDGMVLSGGHAPGMKTYLDSEILSRKVTEFFDQKKIIGAICHGVIVAARTGKLKDLTTTALPKWMELNAWAMTCLWLKNYYRTYPVTVEDEVKLSAKKFIRGPFSLSRDNSKNLDRGFVVRDGNYLSSRWPGDAHRFATVLCQMLEH